MRKGMYDDNGIGLSKSTPKVGDQVDISYKGLLKESGARNVKLYMGYNSAWEDSQYIEMNLSDNIFMATVPIKKEGTLNFAFTDPVGNWDNNSGANYSFHVMGMKSVKGSSPMTGPYNDQPAGKRAIKAGAAQKAVEEAVAPTKKGARAAAPKTTDTAAKKASLSAAEPSIDSVKPARGQRKIARPAIETPTTAIPAKRGRKPKIGP